MRTSTRTGTAIAVLATTFVLWSARARQTSEIQGRLLQGPTTYQIHLRDTVGYLSKDPLWRSIELVQDQAPVVTILSAADRQRIIASGIAEAMYNTAFGLGIAVTCMIAHLILHQRSKNIQHDLDATQERIFNLLTIQTRPGGY